MSATQQEQRPECKRVRKSKVTLDPASARKRIEAAFAKQRPSIKDLWLVPLIAAVWLMAAAYFFFLPHVYQSKWSLILPAASNGSTVSLDTIGQTSTSPSHPFRSASLSPKVIYKEIAGSAQVRGAAAQAMGMQLRHFGKARVKLIDETSLINFKISGATPEQAQAKAKALMSAFEKQLDTLRRDELEKRGELVRENLKIYRANLEEVRNKMLEFKRTSGLLSLEQFKEMSSSEEKLRRKLGAMNAERQTLVARQKSLMARVGLSPDLAAKSIRLASDPAFEQLSLIYAKASATSYEGSRRYGPNHPALQLARLKARGALDQLIKIARRIDNSPSVDIGQLMLVLNASHQSDLFKSIVANEGALAGSAKQMETLTEELKVLEANVTKMGKAAAKLEALQKDHLVAEAVFTSATARLDISRTDIFASYPMVQILAQPDLPENRSQPRLRYAILAGFLGTFFILLAWGAAWFRSRFGRRR